MLEHWKDIVDVMIAVGSLMIASLAFFYSHRLGKGQQKHNELSVKPKLSLNTLIDLESSEILSVKVDLVNIGLGPAIIKSFEVRYDQENSNFNDIGHSLIPIEIQVGVGGYLYEVGDGIAPNSSQWLLDYQYKKSPLLPAQTVRSHLERVTLKIKYTSLYDLEEYELIETGATMFQFPTRASDAEGNEA